ncbi:MAG: hypothetical protein FJW96_05220 [Actinobacteria bacterium]|nr:hypothetical protein [Actinomycetota bacterium]
MTAVAPGVEGDEAAAVVLANGDVVIEHGDPGDRLGSLLEAVRLDPPYRASLRRLDGDTWAVGANRIDVVHLADDPGGEQIDAVWDGAELTVRVDGTPRLVRLPELGRDRRFGGGPWAATLIRLQGSAWEAEIHPL